MDAFPLPVFNIESEDEEEHEEAAEIKMTPRCEHLHKLLSDRSLRNNNNAIQKKLEAVAEDNLLKKDLKETSCSLPGNPRSTFLMVFSPDGSKVASSHGDHNINVTDLRTNKCISTLTGHPRTPWCIAFHPHRNDILASGCLGGQVRVWDLHGGSEMWSVTATEVTTVIASLAFHPSERLLVIATNSTLYFWDWNIPQPFAKCSTANEKQKLRYVSFDPLGNWLLTGISNAPSSSGYFATSSAAPTAPSTTGVQGMYRLERNEQERERNLQSRYQTLLDQYERLRVRYQELRHRAAELELNASTNAYEAPEVPRESLSGSSSDRFWRTLMNAAENLRALSNIGRSLEPGPSSARTSGASLDQDARMRIQLLSRHIENMQRICRSHLEMTRHRRQVYRLQQIRRILEDLREQIRYLQVCVRDSLDLVSRMRTSPASPPAGTNGNPLPAPPTSQPDPINSNGSPRGYSPLVGRLRRIGQDHPRLHLARYSNSPIRRFSRRHRSPPMELIDPQPGTSRDFSMDIDDELDEEPCLERGPNLNWRRCRFGRLARRSLPPPRSNSLLHVRSLSIRRRKPSILSRSLQGRTLQSHLRSVSAPAIPPANPETSQRSAADQSLRPLMERLESHFRLQRQTMGILAQLNEAAGVNEGATAGTSTGTVSFSDTAVSARPWTTNVVQNIRHWRSRRESLERAHSLESRRSTGSNSDRFQVPRRVDSSSSLGAPPPAYRSFRPPEDEDSSDTDTETAAEATNRWRQSGPIRSPRGVEQRMRLLWREYLSQVVHAQNNIGESSGAAQQQAGAESDTSADQERTRYRLWLSTMVESLTSFFSQHGITSSEAEAAHPPVPRPGPSTPVFPYMARVHHPIFAGPDDGTSSPREHPAWRVFPRVGDVAAQQLPQQQRWNLRRNAESQVSLSAHLTYRIQAWDFCTKEDFVPDIRDPHANIVVPESKIHNDASVDVSPDGRFLVTLVPCTSLTGALISLHSLEPSTLGLCLAQVNVDQFVVSVSISPTCGHLLLGLASSRALSVTSRDHALPTLWAQVYQIPGKVFDASDETARDKKTHLNHVRDLCQTTDVGMTSLNCIRWIPTAGQGFVLGTNKGHLKVIA